MDAQQFATKLAEGGLLADYPPATSGIGDVAHASPPPPAPLQFSQLPAWAQIHYRRSQSSGGPRMSEQDAAAYFQKHYSPHMQPGQDMSEFGQLPSELRDRYWQNLAEGRTNLTPLQAAQRRSGQSGNFQAAPPTRPPAPALASQRQPAPASAFVPRPAPRPQMPAKPKVPALGQVPKSPASASQRGPVGANVGPKPKVVSYAQKQSAVKAAGPRMPIGQRFRAPPPGGRGVGGLLRRLGGFAADYGMPLAAGGATAYKAHEQGMDPISSGFMGLATGAVASPRDYTSAWRRSQAARAAGSGNSPMTGLLKELAPNIKMKGGLAALALVPPLATNLHPAVQNMAQSSENIAGATGELQKTLPEVLGHVERGSQSLGSAAGAIESAVPQLQKQLQGGITELQGTAQKQLTEAGSQVKGLREDITKAVDPVAKSVSEAATGIRGDLKGSIEPTAKAIQEGIGPASKAIQEGIGGLPQALSGAVDKAVTGGKEVSQGMLDSLQPAIASISQAGSSVGELSKSLRGLDPKQFGSFLGSQQQLNQAISKSLPWAVGGGLTLGTLHLLHKLLRRGPQAAGPKPPLAGKGKPRKPPVARVTLRDPGSYDIRVQGEEDQEKAACAFASGLAKQALVGGMLLGGGLGAMQAPKGSRPEGFGRGVARGLGTELGMSAGGLAGGVAGVAAGSAMAEPLEQMVRGGKLSPELAMLIALGLPAGGLAAGAIGGGMGGYGLAGKLLGPASYDPRQQRTRQQMQEDAQLESAATSG